MMWDARLLTHIQAKTLLRRKPKWSWERGLNSGRPSVLELLLHPINSSSNWTKTSQIRNQNVKKKSQRMYLSVSQHEESVDTLKQYIAVCVTSWRVRWHSETIHWYRVSVWANFCHIYHSFIWCLNPVIAYYNYLYAISKFFWLKLTIVLCVSLSCLIFHSGL